MIIQLILQLFLKGLMEDLWSLFFSLQLICYLRIYKVSIPSNCEIFLVQIQDLIEFKSLKADSIVQLFWGESMTAQRLIYQWMGVEESSQEALVRAKTIVEELQFFILVIISSILILFIMVSLSLMDKYKAKIRAKLSQLKEKFIWSGAIRSMLLSYFQVCLLAESKASSYAQYSSDPEVRDQEALI